MSRISDPEHRARLERAIKRLEEKRDVARGPYERSRLEGKVEGVKLALAYVEEEDRMEPPEFGLTQFQQQVARDVLLKHRNHDDSFCMAYEECKYRIPWDGIVKMRESFAQHQIDEIVKALS